MQKYTRYFLVGVLLIFAAFGGAFLWQSSKEAAGGWVSKTAMQTDFQVSASNRFTRAVLEGRPLELEVAETEGAKERGLGGRVEVPDGYGMLFIFDTSSTYGFWMKDMLVPIDIVWLDANGQVVSIQKDVSPNTYPTVFYPTSAARYVLETKAGLTSEYDIRIGTVLEGLPSTDDVLR